MMIFGTQEVYEVLLNMYNFLDNRLGNVHTLRRDVNEFLSVLSTSLLRFGYISVQGKKGKVHPFTGTVALYRP
jgi:hypothetical protein